MDDLTLAHLDERSGHVAVDMGLITMSQFDECRREIVRLRRENSPGPGLGEVALKLGFIDRDDLAILEAEEKRRRRLISGYEIIDLIGSGTIATVYRARQRAMDRTVALKILHPRLAADPEFVKAYIAEAQAVSRFHHPHIVQGIDVGESRGFYYFAHEYLSGGSLLSHVGSHGLSEDKALLHLRQTTSALRHAWEAAVFHGDLNPGNLLLDSQGDVKLANLGVPRFAKPRDGNLAFVRTGPEYAAPEQLECPDLVNARTDIYSLGATFYHISFGTPPFRGGSVDEIVRNRIENPYPSFDPESVGGFSQKYVAFIRCMVEPDPEKRPSDPDDLARRLEKFHMAGADDLSGLARRVRQTAEGKRPRPARRGSAAPSSPRVDESDRRFALSRRPDAAPAGPLIRWLAVALAAVAALAAFLLLR